jgi:hypothetical protein
MSRPTILVQLDTDPQPSVFDAVVAIDAGAEHLLRHGGVTPEAVTGLVHGALFTRGPGDLHRTAIFLGGSDVAAAEALLVAVRRAFFGPFRVSVLLDPNGSNTTAAAAVLAAIAGAGGSLAGRRVAVLGGTGPVGQRVARLCAREGAMVALASRSVAKAQAAAEAVAKATGASVWAFSGGNEGDLLAGLAGAEVVVAAGAAGAQLLPLSVRKRLPDLKAVIDLNAVPPLGIEGVEATDRDTARDGVRAWGALGVGGTKMKIHKAAIRRLFEANDAVLDAEECLAIGRELTS